MAKNQKEVQNELSGPTGQLEQPVSGDTSQVVEFFNKPEEMTLEEAAAYRAALYKPEAKELSIEEEQNLFRMWWAEQKYRYGQPKELEEILWLHLKAIDHTRPDQFEKGLANFGLKG